MKAVMMSIQPKWCELIASGKKTVEVRKTKPKLEVPFKVYIYETKDKRYENIGVCGWKEDGTKYIFNNHCGKVIGEFVCDFVFPIWDGYTGNLGDDCLTYEERENYLNGEMGYGWHITDLVIYDKPRELRSFFKPRTAEELEADIAVAILTCGIHGSPYAIKKPPKSWCYVEEVKG